jgi:iron complex outermembrane receptor protein
MVSRRGSGSAGAGRRLLAGTCFAALAALSQPVMAQDRAGAEADEGGVEEIIVTARFVTENLQDTPMAITAQTGEQLEAANVTNVGTLGAVIPNLFTVPGDAQSAGTPRIALRGVTQGASSSLAVPPALAIYTDDIYHGTTAGSELDFTDIERLEVNRGPQSTLSGNASIGGSIKLYTKDPQGDGSGYLQIVGGSRKKLGISGAIDIGLTDTLALRASGNFEQQQGHGNRLDFACQMDKNGTPELKGGPASWAGSTPVPYAQPDSAERDCIIGHTGGGKFAVGQVKLRWQPTSEIDVLLTARHREEDLEETPEVVYSFVEPCVTGLYGPQPCATGASNQALHRAALQTFGVVSDNRFVPAPRNGGIRDTYATNCRPLLDISGIPGFPADYPRGFCYDRAKPAHHTLFSGKVAVQLSDSINLTAIAGYTDYANAFTQHSDQSPVGYTISHFENENWQTSGEVRLDGTLFDDRLSWVLGAFKLHMNGQQNNMLSFQTTYQVSKVRGINDSQSGFFHLDYNLTDAWRISGGARYSDTQIAITINNPNSVSVLTPVTSGDKRIDWLISTDYRVTDDILAYASAASGSRPAGLTTIVGTPRQLAPTPAEELISYEAGIKADLFHRRLRTNLTAFYMDYKQLSTAIRGFECRNQPGPVATFFDNAAACAQFPGPPDQVTFNISVGIPAKVRGFEWEITAIPVDGLRIDWNGGYNKFTSGIKTPGQPGYFYPGNHRQPSWNMHANVSYDIESSLGTITPRLGWNWQSQQDFESAPQLQAPRPYFIIAPYSLWNAQIAYEAPDGDWSATLQVNNLANKYYHYQLIETTFNRQTRVAPPREVSLTIRRAF